MTQYESLYELAVVRKGGETALADLLPIPKEQNELAVIDDSRLLSHMSKCIFKAGFVWRVIDNKWEGFEKAFHKFDIESLRLMSDEAYENLMSDESIVRNWQKIKAVRDNVQFLSDIIEEYGSFAGFIADWPIDNIIGLWAIMKKRGSRLGGNTGQYFLRGIGKDTFILTQDVVACLINHGIVDKQPTSKRDLQKVQDTFNQWHEESQRPLCQISKILACTVG